jgi:hypothetical protein
MNKQRLQTILARILKTGFRLEPVNEANIETIYFKQGALPVEIKKQFVEYLKENPELEIFNGTMMQFANAAHRIEIDDLWRWLLRKAVNFGVEVAVDKLEEYCALDRVPGYSILVINGLEVNSALDLSDGISLIPIADLPLSLNKKWLLNKERKSVCTMISLFREEHSKAALILKTFGSKPIKSNGIETVPCANETMFSKLEDACFCLTLLEKCSPTPFIFWWEPEEWTPCLPIINGSSNSFKEDDFINRSLFKLTDSKLCQRAQKIHQLFSGLSDKAKLQLRVPLERLNFAKRKSRPVNAAIDLGMAFEALFLQESSPSAQLSLALRLRAAWLLGENGQDRKSKFDLFKWFYTCRSIAVHSGQLDQKIKGIPINTDVVIKGSIQEAARAIEIIMQRGGYPDWDSLVLDIIN